MIRKVKRSVYDLVGYLRMPADAKKEYRRDRSGLPDEDPGWRTALEESIEWICRAQDNSSSQDGGVSRHFSFITGWSPSYPETTGYIIPTLIAYSKFIDNREQRDFVLKRAKRMLDWLVSIQFQDGSFYGGVAGNNKANISVTFNTGQILLGLVSGVSEFGDRYRVPMSKTADWLAANQDPDGCWRKFPSPFVKPGEKVYDAHVAWGLFEAARIEPTRNYDAAALANIRWALSLQKDNGWFDKCCLVDPSKPLTHTLGYTLRGILEAYRYAEESDLLQASIKTADGLVQAINMEDGFLPGRLYANWKGAVPWSCLTGSVQIAICWLMLYEYTGNATYLEAAVAANRYVRRTLATDGPDGIRGGIKGSFPIYGEYGKDQYLNWAAKFFADSAMLELTVRGQ